MKNLMVDPDNENRIVLWHKGEKITLPRRCPHQGAPMETGHLKDGRLVCAWHGCFYDLESKQFCSSTVAPQRRSIPSLVGGGLGWGHNFAPAVPNYAPLPASPLRGEEQDTVGEELTPEKSD